jgi:hypothetical protein
MPDASLNPRALSHATGSLAPDIKDLPSTTFFVIRIIFLMIVNY